MKSYLFASSTLSADVFMQAPGLTTKSTPFSLREEINSPLSSSNRSSFKCACESKSIFTSPYLTSQPSFAPTAVGIIKSSPSLPAASIIP